MELQEKLRCLRKENNISQIELAEELNVSRQTVSRWEAGASIPTTENLMRLSDLYQVPLGSWMNKDWAPPAVSEPVPNLAAQAEPDTPLEDAVHEAPQKPILQRFKWGMPLAAFLLGIGLALGTMFFLGWRERPVPMDKLDSEVIDFSTLGEAINGLPPMD